MKRRKSSLTAQFFSRKFLMIDRPSQCSNKSKNMSSGELDSATGAPSLMASNWWTDAWLALKPCDQLCFKRARGSQWCDAAKRQTMVFCQSFYRILAQSKKSCDYSQLQPSIRTSCHPNVSSFSRLYPFSTGPFEITSSRPAVDMGWFVFGPADFA